MCAIYYDREALPGIIAYVKEHEKRLPADLLLGEYTNDTFNRYATPTGLVQHVGGVSAGTSPGAYWCDGRFNMPVKCWDPGWIEQPYAPHPLRKK